MNWMYQRGLVWEETRRQLDSVCDRLGLKWYYKITTAEVIFHRSNPVEHDLSVCFGSPDYSIMRESAMWMSSSQIESILREWLDHGV
jgi:hypothetical protein